jgi:DNA-binding Lrp family transcriptional regulator
MNHNWFAPLPASVLLSKTLTDKQKLLIALIANLMNERGYCFASNKYLGECLDCSESTIKDHLKKLEEVGILGRIIKLKPNGDFDFRSLVINLEIPHIPQPEKTTTLAEKLANPPARKLAHNNIVINRKELIPNISFNTWWDLYDKKVGSKTKLESKWNKLTDNERILAINHTKEYIIAQPDKQYRKNPDTYFNNESFYDEIIKPKEFKDQVPTNKITTQIKLK